MTKAQHDELAAFARDVVLDGFGDFPTVYDALSHMIEQPHADEWAALQLPPRYRARFRTIVERMRTPCVNAIVNYQS